LKVLFSEEEYLLRDFQREFFKLQLISFQQFPEVPDPYVKPVAGIGFFDTVLCGGAVTGGDVRFGELQPPSVIRGDQCCDGGIAFNRSREVAVSETELPEAKVPPWVIRIHGDYGEIGRLGAFILLFVKIIIAFKNGRDPAVFSHIGAVFPEVLLSVP